MPSTVIQVSTSTNVFLKALQWGGWKWDDGGGPGTNITYYFGSSNVDISFRTALGINALSSSFTEAERSAYQKAVQEWSNVANITFTETFSPSPPDTDWVELAFFDADGDFLGAHETPLQALQSNGTAWGAYNFNGVGWTDGGLKKGGFGYNTLVHELGHALGLSHPHDMSGGQSGLFPGVTAGDSADRGSFDLNQGMFTVMGYNHGWETGLKGVSTSLNYGWSSTPMAFDIAAIQALYGANMNYHKGNDKYVLRHVNGQPDDLMCIWDAGGTDSIVYGGSYSCIIDLRAATLQNAPGGGGYVSYADGAPKGSLDHWNAITIANGVKIENAVGGKGNDDLIGNQWANKLTGGLGRDTLKGGSGADDFDFNSIKESARGGKRDYITDFQRGKDDIDLRDIDAKTGSGNQKFKFIGQKDFSDTKGELRYTDKGSKCLVQGDVNGDGTADFEIMVKVGSLGKGDFLL